MRLKSFHVRLFRNIIDSGPIAVDDVTCLVGKNEAGKSALLQALHHLNPAKPEMTLSILDEYPRWLKKKHESAGDDLGKVTPITATFEFSDDEKKSLNERFGPGVVVGSEIEVVRTYASSHPSVEPNINYKKFLEPFVDGLSERLQAKLGSLETTDQLRTGLASLVDARDAEDSESVALAGDAQTAIGQLNERLGSGNLRNAVVAAIREMLPRTFYFSTYAQLLGRYPLQQVFAAVRNGTDEEEVRAAADFLRLAKVVPETMETWDYEASNAELEATSSLLTQSVREHWKQNDQLKLRVNIENQPGTAPNGQPSIDRFLQFRVEDLRHDFTNRLDRRSTGFRWFVSFMASFLEFESDQNLILLLDEPGLSLHARAQMDLLNTIEGTLAAGRQVLYSTHSPFMVRTGSLSHARIIEDQGGELGTIAVNDAGVVSDPDTLFPLQAALGYDIVQSLFIGNRNVVVEGISDFIYLSLLSDHLKSLGKTSLPDDCRVLPAGGATNIPTFIALLGGKLDFVVLVDGGADQQKIATAIAKGKLDAAQIVSLDAFTDVPKPDIEDLFEPAEYVTLYNAALGLSVSLDDLDGDDRIVKRLERANGEFNHGVVAAYFLRNLDESITSLSTATVDRFNALIEALVAALP